VSRGIQHRNKPRALYLNSSSDFRITDQDGATVSLEDARLICESGAIQDWNLAFQRLVRERFDLEAVKAAYAREREQYNTLKSRGQI